MAKNPPKSNPKKTARSNPLILKKSLFWRYVVIVFASAFLLYANTLGHDYSLDDDIYTKKNRFIQQGFSALPSIFNKGSLVGFNNANESNYRPLVLLNFMVDTAFVGNNPHFEHFINVLLFGLTCVMLFLLLLKAFKHYNPMLALLMTLVFVFHPIHTEVVASIKSRDELLGWLFGICSFYYLFVYADKLFIKKYLVASVLFFTASIFCKENGLTFIVVIPLLLYFFTSLDLKKIAQVTAPFMIVIIGYMVIRTSVLESITFKDKLIVMNNGLMAAKSTGEMLATNFLILGKYLWLLVFPSALTWDYSYAQVPIVSFMDWRALLPLALHLFLGVYVVMRFSKKDVFVFAILFYLITIFLSSNLVVKIGATMGERFLYVPSLGFCIALVVGIFQLLKIDLVTMEGKNKTNVWALFAVVFLLFGFKTFDRNKAWKNNFELFGAGLEVSTGSARAHFAVASEYRELGEKEPDGVKRMQELNYALQEYKKGIEIYAEDQEVWYNMGVTYYDMGDTANARQVYAKALAINPNYTIALNNTGVIYFAGHNYPMAMQCFNKILATDSTFFDAFGNLGACYHNMGNFEKATYYYQKVLARNPRNKSMLNNIALAYRQMGDTVKATAYMQKAAAIP